MKRSRQRPGGEGERGDVTADTTNNNSTLCSAQRVQNRRDPLKLVFPRSVQYTSSIFTIPRNNTFSVAGFAAVLLLGVSVLDSSASHRPYRSPFLTLPLLNPTAIVHSAPRYQPIMTLLYKGELRDVVDSLYGTACGNRRQAISPRNKAPPATALRKYRST